MYRIVASTFLLLLSTIYFTNTCFSNAWEISGHKDLERETLAHSTKLPLSDHLRLINCYSKKIIQFVRYLSEVCQLDSDASENMQA